MPIRESIQKFHKELPPGVELVAVSKFHPIEDILEAYSAGQRIFAESRPQELYEKVKCIAELPADVKTFGASPLRPSHCVAYAPCGPLPFMRPRAATVFPASQEVPLTQTCHCEQSQTAWQSLSDIVFHFIGHLQTNKLKLVLPYVTMVQSVDSLHLLETIDRWCVLNGRRMDVLLEYHVSADETKHGFDRNEILAILGRAGDFKGINFRGLMGMASLTDDEAIIRGDFSRIQALFDEIRNSTGLSNAVSSNLSAFDQLSIGMSDDWRIAVEYGSTMVRIGTAIFGERKY